MKKLIVSLLLSVVAVNAFGMEAAKIAKYQYRLEMTKQNDEIIKMGLLALGVIGTSLFAAPYISETFTSYLKHLERNAQNPQSTNNSQKSNWGAYGKIATGVGLTGLTAYLGMKQTTQPKPMEINYSASGSGDVGNTLTPNIMISFGSLYTLAPMIPAYFFLKSGFKDLETK